MKTPSAIRAMLVVGSALVGLIACAPPQQNLANPVVRGDRSTIQGDANATQLQKTEPE